MVASACGGPERDIHRAFNSRDVGPYLTIGRARSDEGFLVVHVVAHQPEHAEHIAQQIVRQNYATAAEPIRVIVDPASGEGERRVYRWDGEAMDVDTSTDGLPPRPDVRAVHAAEAAH